MTTSFRLNTTLLVYTGLIVGGLVLVTRVAHGWQLKAHARNQIARADEAAEEQNADELIASLNRSLGFDASDRAVRVRYGLAMADWAKEPAQRRRALKALRQAMAYDQGTQVRQRAAEIALGLGEPSDAIRYLEPLLRKSPRADLYQFAARCHLAAREISSAIDALRKALQLDPADVSSAVMLVGIYRDKTDRPQHAEAVLDRLVQDNPRQATAWLARARYLVADNRLDRAEANLVEARRLSANDPEVLAACADLAMRRGQFDQARNDWQQALKHQPDNAEYYLGLARAYQRLGETIAVEATLRTAVSRFPTHVDLLFTLTEHLVEHGNPAEAESFRKRLPLPAAQGRSLYLAGRLSQRDRRWGVAARTYLEAEQAPDVTATLGSRMRLELAKCYLGLGAREEQFLATEQAVQLSPTPEARLALAELLVSAGRSNEALPHLRALSRLSTPPGNTWALLTRALLEHYRTRPGWTRHWQEVNDALEHLARDPEQVVTTALFQAELLRLREKPAEARAILEETLHRYPEEAGLYLALADLASRQGDTALVGQILEQGDEAIGDRRDWLQARAKRAVRERDASSYRELTSLEERASNLPTPERATFLLDLAELHARLGNHDNVDRLCLEIVRNDPGLTRVWVILVDALLARRLVAPAEQIIEGLRQGQGPQGLDWRSARVSCELTKAHMSDRESLKKASRVLDEIRQRRPMWARTNLLAGRLAEAEGRLDDAIKSYQQMQAHSELPANVLGRLVRLLSEKNRWSEALASLDQAERTGGVERGLWRRWAWIALHAEQPERACELAHRAVPAGTRSSRDLVWLCRMLSAAGRETEANDLFAEVTRRAPTFTEGWLAQLEFLVRHKRTEEAESLVTLMESELPPARRGLAIGQAQEILGRYHDAERAYRDILRRTPNDAEALSRLANLYLRRNEPIKAERVLMRLLDPQVVVSEEDLPEWRRLLALAITAPEQRKDRVNQALALLAQNRGQGDAEADRRVAALVGLARPTDRAKALAALERLPGGSARTPLEQLRLAQLYDATGNWPRARELYLGLVGHDRANGGYLAVLIDGLLRQGKKSEAANYLRHLAQLEPSFPRLREFEQRLRGEDDPR
jgi:tetratricopeptide (TPR) repeat protein